MDAGRFANHPAIQLSFVRSVFICDKVDKTRINAAFLAPLHGRCQRNSRPAADGKTNRCDPAKIR